MTDIFSVYLQNASDSWAQLPSVQLCLLVILDTLYDLMNCSMPGFPVHHHSWSLPKLMSMETVMSYSHLILCCPLLFLPSVFPSMRIFSNESVLCIRWPKYWSFSFSISPSRSEEHTLNSSHSGQSRMPSSA